MSKFLLREMPVFELDVWAGNPRKTIDQTKLAELAESIKSIGVQQPLVVRIARGATQVIAGQRRFLAAQIAGVETVPCLIRDLDDEQALEVAIAENAARTDVSPIEEAEAIEAYTRKGRTIEQAANRFGRSVLWVERRVRLLALIPAWRERLAADDCPIRHAELVAGLTEDVQTKLAARWNGCTLPAHYEFERSVHAALHRLDNAPFDITDDTYPSGSCGPCATRTDKQRDLFSDGSSEEVAACLNPSCWAAKVETRWERAQEDAKKRKLTVLTGREAGLVGSGLCMPSAPWIEAERAMKQYAALKPRAIARTDDGLVVELVARADYERARDAQLEALRHERDARKAARGTQHTGESEESDEETVETAPSTSTPADSSEADDEESVGDERARNIREYAPLVRTLVTAFATLDGARANAFYEAGLGQKPGLHLVIRDALGLDKNASWNKLARTLAPSTMLDALIIDALCGQLTATELAAEIKSHEWDRGATPLDAPAPSAADDVTAMVARLSSAIDAADNTDELGAVWGAIESEDHRASLAELARRWLERAAALGLKPAAIKKLRKARRAPPESLAA